MVRVVIGSLVGGIAMFIVGFLFWATPLQYLGYSRANDAQNAAVQLSLAQNLPGARMGLNVLILKRNQLLGPHGWRAVQD